MTLEELLDELRENLLRDVSTAVDQDVEGELWSDRALVRYINDAHEKFAARALCLRDATTPTVTQITLVAGQQHYTLDHRVRAVLTARMDPNRRLGRTSHGFGLIGGKQEISPASVTIECTRTGLPEVFFTDYQTDSIGFYPVPSAAEAGLIVHMQVARLPLEKLTQQDLEAVPEVPEEYHLDMIEWAAWRALRNHDVDAENMNKASAHKTRFEDALKELEKRVKQQLAQEFQFYVQSWR